MKRRHTTLQLYPAPCSSVTPARDNHDCQESDSQLLRGPQPTEIWGSKDLNEEENVRESETLAIMGANTAKLMLKAGKPWVSETPRRKPGKACVHLLPEWLELADNKEVHTETFSTHAGRTLLETYITNVLCSGPVRAARARHHPKRCKDIDSKSIQASSMVPTVRGEGL